METITERNCSRYYFLFSPLLSTCNTHGETRRRRESRVDGRRRLAQHLTLKAQNIACAMHPTLFGLPRAFLSPPPLLRLPFSFSNRDFFRAPCYLTLGLYRSPISSPPLSSFSIRYRSFLANTILPFASLFSLPI